MTFRWAEPQAEVEYGRRWDERALDLSFNYSPKLDDDSGRGHITTHAAGEPERTDVLDTRADKRKVEASANWRQPLAGGRLTLTAARRGEAGSTRTRIGSGEDAERVSAREDFREAELGARFVRARSGHEHVCLHEVRAETGPGRASTAGLSANRKG